VERLHNDIVDTHKDAQPVGEQFADGSDTAHIGA
jgi:hypothetical protein